LFVLFTKVGITVGAAIGGWFISHLGIHQFIWCGIMFALLAFLLIIEKWRFNAKIVKNGLL